MDSTRATEERTETEPTETTPTETQPTSIGQAIERLSQDGFIGYPTETVWGLGACADRPMGIDRIFDWKGRSPDQPMSILVPSREAAIVLGCHFDAHAERLARAFWPGPLTIVVSCEGSFAPGVARADGAMGLRCSAHPVVLGLVEAMAEAGLGPLTSTSLNRTGFAPAEDFKSVEALVGPGEKAGLALPLLIWAEASGALCDAGAGLPSSVVDCTGARPKLLRAGALDAGWLERVWSESSN